MLAALTGNFPPSPTQKYGSDVCNEPVSSGSSLVCLFKTMSCVGLCLAGEKAPGEFDLILTGLFAFDPS